jgi:UDP-N-acetylmuramate dehydrogenase
VEFFEGINVGEMTTFAIPAKADLFCEVNNVDDLSDLSEFLKTYKGDYIFLSGGSNTVFIEDYEGLVIKMNLDGWSIIAESDTEVLVKVNAGVNWHEFVMWAVENNYGGLENLVLIPGNVGTSPVQNIGAYGVEVKDLIRRLDFFDFESGEIKKMLNEDCEFGYRDSIFKHKLKGKGVISAVEFRLSKKGYHKMNTSYKPVAQAIENIEKYSIEDIANIIIGIRTSKLPDWKKVGTAGSFFKNPIVDIKLAKSLLDKFPDMPIYPHAGSSKLAAGWLIDQCGLKGREFGTIGVYNNQALVLVNLLAKGPASGEDLKLAIKTIQDCVKARFGVDLICEVNVIGYSS